MTSDRADWHLINWANWMRADQFVEFSLRGGSLESGYQRATDVDELIRVVDRVTAVATYAAVRDLSILFREAVEVAYLDRVWTHVQLLSPIVSMAQRRVADSLERRGIV